MSDKVNCENCGHPLGSGSFHWRRGFLATLCWACATKMHSLFQRDPSVFSSGDPAFSKRMARERLNLERLDQQTGEQ